MLALKSFSDTKIVFIDDKGEEYTLTCDKDGQRFDRDIIEDILDWAERTKK